MLPKARGTGLWVTVSALPFEIFLFLIYMIENIFPSHLCLAYDSYLKVYCSFRSPYRLHIF